jgi:hypothetical protein
MYFSFPIAIAILIVAIIEVCIFKHTKAQDTIKQAKPGIAAS